MMPVGGHAIAQASQGPIILLPLSDSGRALTYGIGKVFKDSVELGAESGDLVVVLSANYKNTTLFWNIFKNAIPIFQKYHTGDLRTPDAVRISPLVARNTPQQPP